MNTIESKAEQWAKDNAKFVADDQSAMMLKKAFIAGAGSGGVNTELMGVIHEIIKSTENPSENDIVNLTRFVGYGVLLKKIVSDHPSPSNTDKGSGVVRWVKASERLPEKLQWYYCIIQEGEDKPYRKIVCFLETEWYMADFEKNAIVTHWLSESPSNTDKEGERIAELEKALKEYKNIVSGEISLIKSFVRISNQYPEILDDNDRMLLDGIKDMIAFLKTL